MFSLYLIQGYKTVLVSALGPALVCFVLLASLVGYYVRRMKVFVLAYDQPIVL